jgi:hypothetical protein
VFVATPVIHEDAKAFCTAMNGHLAIIRNPAQNAMIASLVTGVDSFIGATDLVTEGTFVWDDGSPLTYTNWRTGEPSSGGGMYEEDWALVEVAKIQMTPGDFDWPCSSVTERRGRAIRLRLRILDLARVVRRRPRVRSVLVLGCVACGSPQAVAPAPASAPIGNVADGGVVRLAIDGERIAAVTPAGATTTWLWPPMIDSHVHLALYPVAEQLAATGVEGAVDLAAPEHTLGVKSPIESPSSAAQRRAASRRVDRDRRGGPDAHASRWLSA